MQKLHLQTPLCFIDLETTGINIVKDRIIEIAVIKLFPDGTKKEKRDYVHPTIPIPKSSTAIHGITDEDVANKPTFQQIAQTYASFFEDSDFSGFNIIRFDIPILIEEFLRAGINVDYSQKKMIDSQQIYHMMEKRDLSAAYKFYCNKTLTNAHTALADTQASMEVLEAQIACYQNQAVIDKHGNKKGIITNNIADLHQLTTSNKVDMAGHIIKNNQGDIVINFGKYKGERLIQILQKDRSYYQWIMKSDFPIETKKVISTIKKKENLP